MLGKDSSKLFSNPYVDSNGSVQIRPNDDTQFWDIRISSND